MFTGLPIIAEGKTWTLYRDPAVLLVRFHGNIDDEASAAWRTAAQANIDAVGWPRFAFVAPTEGTATTTLSSRMRTVAFLRHTAQHVEKVAIVSDTSTSFVIRTILRAAGVPNVELVEVADAARMLASMRG